MDVAVAPPTNVTVLADRRLLHVTVIDQLRDLIVQGELAPETKLNERVLAEKLGTSRTPLREAIKSLAAEGLVELLPNRGAVAAQLGRQDVVDAFEVIAGLEGMSGELAAARITDVPSGTVTWAPSISTVTCAGFSLAGVPRSL